jgi:hypothetical protein
VTNKNDVNSNGFSDPNEQLFCSFELLHIQSFSIHIKSYQYRCQARIPLAMFPLLQVRVVSNPILSLARKNYSQKCSGKSGPLLGPEVKLVAPGPRSLYPINAVFLNSSSPVFDSRKSN